MQRIKLNFFAVMGFLSILVALVPVEIEGGVFVSHLWIVILTAALVIWSFLKGFVIGISIFFYALLILFFDLTSFLYRGFLPTYFLQELLKVLLLLLGIWSFSVIFRYYSFVKIAAPICVGLVFYCFAYYLLVEDSFTYGGRFQVSMFGSSNTLAVIMAFCCICLLWFGEEKSNSYRYFFYLAAIVAVLIILMAESRGGLFTLFLGLFLLKRKYFLGFKFLFVALVSLSLFAIAGGMDDLINRFFGFGDGYSSGRIEIWKYLLSDISEDVFALFFGFGSGSVDFEMFNKLYNSAHSGPLTILYYYGCFALLLFLWFYGVRLVSLLAAKERIYKVKLAIMVAFLFTFFTDNLFLASQGTIYFSLFLGFALSNDAVARE